ncbi:MAG: hypothetical protein ACK4SI_10340 [Brevundimonas aurantiaca]|uniref:hypothetical protein n=1 Tax=Brevundimonas aurantiaca TaxID=74316 RepID=UPI00391C9BD9
MLNNTKRDTFLGKKNRQSNRKPKKTIIGEDTAAAGQIFAVTDDGLISKTAVTTK